MFLDAEATAAKAALLVKEAASHGAELIVFPESFIPAYPDWVWRTPAWQDSEFVKRFYANAVSVPGPILDVIGEAAAEASAYVVMGVNEIDGGTLYNTLVYLGPDGQLLQRHRKLMPTGGERTVWGMGDGSELGVVSTPFGVIGGLLCWENYMPLARAAIYAQHCDIYLAPTWDNSDSWVSTLRHIAKEGRQFVIGVAPLLRGSDVPEELRGEVYGLEDDWMSRGHTTIVAPGGRRHRRTGARAGGDRVRRPRCRRGPRAATDVRSRRPLLASRRLHAARGHAGQELRCLRRGTATPDPQRRTSSANTTTFSSISFVPVQPDRPMSSAPPRRLYQ